MLRLWNGARIPEDRRSGKRRAGTAGLRPAPTIVALPAGRRLSRLRLLSVARSPAEGRGAAEQADDDEKDDRADRGVGDG